MARLGGLDVVSLEFTGHRELEHPMTEINPRLDLTLTRTIHAPRHRIWRAWTDADLLARWYRLWPASTVLTCARAAHSSRV